MSQHFTLFETAIGRCGLIWNAVGVVGVQLPEATAKATIMRLRMRYPLALESAPSSKIKRITNKVVALLNGKQADLLAVPLDTHGLPPFHQQVYTLARQIPAGSTLSYGEVAARLGKPGAARAVGQAMRRNPFPIIMPCHRVLAAGGKLGGFTANGGTDTKRRLLQIEGVILADKSASQRGNPQVSSKAKTKLTYSFNVCKAVVYLRAVDAQLASLMDQVGPFRMTINQTQDVFLALAESIVYQQLHGKAAATIFKRVCELFPRSGEYFTAKDIWRCADDKLRGAGLSQNKLLALRDLAEKTLDGSVPALSELHTLDDERIVERLISVRGIGRWTVEMLLMFRLGRPDVLPVDDFGVRKGFMLTYNKREMPTPKQLKAYGERWAPYRSIASWYMWRA
ncbi:MAG: methylated-DNA--[protein]-cysteine S-methyltransferase, partial [Steroidobacteraceae bacterium]